MSGITKLMTAGGGGVSLTPASSIASDVTVQVPSIDSTLVVQNASNNLLMNSGYGSDAVAYGCRAWVNFNGTGTVAIRASGNVSSITDNNTGDYTINFSTSMPDANYSITAIGNKDSSSSYGWFMSAPYATSPTTSAVRIACSNGSGTFSDFDYVNAAVFR